MYESTRTLRPYQQDAIAELRQAIGHGSRRPMLQLPTGGGKTAIAGEIIRLALAKGGRVAFCVPAVSLIGQTVESFAQAGILDVGVIQAQHPMWNPGASVQVCSIQTIERRAFPDVTLVIVDEAHRMFKVIAKWMDGWPHTVFVGLSATPWAKGLGKLYDNLIIGGTTAQMIADGYLSDFRVFAPSHPDLTGVKTVAGDYHEGQLADAMDKPKLIGDAVESWLKLGEGRPTIVFAVNRAHAKHLQNEFERAGVSAGYIDAYTDMEERARIAEAFADGEIQVVCNVGCLTTGVDWDVRCIVLCRPTKSKMLFVQMMGRGLRTADGKSDLIIIDHSDTHLNLGFVTDIHETTLDDGKHKESSKTEKEQPLPKECSKCHFLKPPKTAECPACGFKPERQSEIEHEEGELQEIRGKKKRYSTEEKQRWYSMLIGVCRNRGYQDGWAYHKYMSKFGVAPSNKFSKSPLAPDAEVWGWVKHMQIREAKRKK
jgi:DNA repair protein RadD